MRKIATIFFTFCISLAYAQPTITSSILPIKGDTIILGLDTILQPPGNAGTNVTWDFSYLTQHIQSSRIYKDPAATPYASEFTPATLARTDGIGSLYTYWKNVGNTSTYYGFVEPAVNSHQNYDSIPVTYYSFPLNYNDATVTNFYSVTNPGNIKGAGKYYYNADGWGTLKLPHRTVSNVLRTKSVLYIGDSTINSYSLTKEYAWYSPTQKDVLLVISSVLLNGTLYRKYVFFDNHFGTGIKNIDASNSIHVYPNPGNGIFQFDVDNYENETLIQCMDYTGKLLMSKEMNGHSETIDLTSFGKGLYFIKITNSNYETIKKVIVE